MLFVWDADGVLFRTFDAAGRFAWSARIKEDLGISGAVLKEVFGPLWNEVLCGRAEARDHVSDVFGRLGVAVPVDSFLAYWLEKDSVVNDAVLRFVDRVPSVIGSNQDRLRTERFHTLFAGHFQKIYAASGIGAMKPEAAFFAHIEQDQGLAGAELCLIDDLAQNVEAARARGWLGHHFTGVEGLAAFFEEQGFGSYRRD